MASESWETVEKDALWALTHAQELAPGGRVAQLTPILRLWSYSPQGAYTSWTVLGPGEANDLESCIVREVVWKRTRDRNHMASVDRKNMLRTKPQSTVRFRDAEIASQDLAPYLETAAALFVPAILEEDPVAESDSSGIEGYGPLVSLRMEWQEPCPTEWAQSVAWVTDLRELLKGSLVERERDHDG